MCHKAKPVTKKKKKKKAKPVTKKSKIEIIYKSRTKMPIRINKQCNAQGSTKSLQRTNSIHRLHLCRGVKFPHNDWI